MSANSNAKSLMAYTKQLISLGSRSGSPWDQISATPYSARRS